LCELEDEICFLFSFFFFFGQAWSVFIQYLNRVGVKCVLRGFLAIPGNYLL